ncbi:PhnD/SsuA/transferrin family substrate-binding protein [Marinospirillum sp.]|uniref:PhnD/SsuA/transferrin family substrate-binding protein n=1 Tax=Marinospirillum sp. TaxID=2183934 RepID=UPI00384E35E3
MQERFQPLVDHLNSQLTNTQIELLVLSQSQLEDAIAANQLDLLFTNPSHYIHLRHHYSLHGVLATLVNREQEIPVRQLGGVILASKSSGIQTLSDLQGHEVAIPGKRFLGGFQTQAYELLETEQLNIPSDVKVRELGSHDAVIQSLISGQSEVGFVRTGILEQFFTSVEQLPSHLRLINPQQYPDYPFALSTRLYPEWPLVTVKPCPCEREILRSLINLAPDHPAVQKLGIDGFAPPADYSTMEMLAKALHLPPYARHSPIHLDDLWEEYRWPLALSAVFLLLLFTFTVQQYRSNKHLATTLKQLKRQEEATHLAQTALEEKAELLKQSNNELEQFAYVASHDLRQPLRMITSYLQMLEKRLSGQLDEETRELFHFAVDGAKRQDEMLKSLLEYSRVGRIGEPLVLVDSKKHLAEALAFLNPDIKQSLAQIEIQGNNWPRVEASPNELTRLFQNLISNAIKYHQPDLPPEISVSVKSSEDYWIFKVEDQGIGINPNQFDRLFKVFQRLHTRSQYEGTGIGLALCHKIVARHGGSIWVESDGEDQGTRFFFTLPRVKQTSCLSAG